MLKCEKNRTIRVWVNDDLPYLCRPRGTFIGLFELFSRGAWAELNQNGEDTDDTGTFHGDKSYDIGRWHRCTLAVTHRLVTSLSDIVPGGHAGSGSLSTVKWCALSEAAGHCAITLTPNYADLCQWWLLRLTMLIVVLCSGKEKKRKRWPMRRRKRKPREKDSEVCPARRRNYSRYQQLVLKQ